jgi:hypothetical protein
MVAEQAGLTYINVRDWVKHRLTHHLGAAAAAAAVAAAAAALQARPPQHRW